LAQVDRLISVKNFENHYNMKEILITPKLPDSLRSNPQTRQAVEGLLKVLPADKHSEAILSLTEATKDLDSERSAFAAQRTAGQIYQEYKLQDFRDESLPKGEGPKTLSAPPTHSANPYNATGEYDSSHTPQEVDYSNYHEENLDP
jgi:hypothetical protein